MKSSSVSVILVNYNSLNDTKECIESLRTSGINPFIILIDNGSNQPEKIREQLKDYDKELQILFNEKNVGFGKANNIGIDWILKNTSSDYIFLLNNDTIVQNDTIEKLIEPLKNNTASVSTCKILYNTYPYLVWYGGGELHLNTGKQRITDFGRPSTENGANKSRHVSFASGCAMMFRRPVLEEIKGFDERFFMYVEDLELCLRLQEKKYKIWYTADTFIFHKVHGSSNENSQLPALHPKNPKLDFYVYHMSKNLLLTMNMHLNRMAWLKFVLHYLMFMTYKNLLYIFYGKYSASKSFGKAVTDFLREK